MGFKLISIVFFVAAIYLVQHTNAIPRDSSIADAKTVSKIEDLNKKVKDIPYQTGVETVPGIPGRVTCSHEEATEDAKCQAHCLPKGYSYGICVSGTCSCI